MILLIQPTNTIEYGMLRCWGAVRHRIARGHLYLACCTCGWSGLRRAPPPAPPPPRRRARAPLEGRRRARPLGSCGCIYTCARSTNVVILLTPTSSAELRTVKAKAHHGSAWQCRQRLVAHRVSKTSGWSAPNAAACRSWTSCMSPSASSSSPRHGRHDLHPVHFKIRGALNPSTACRMKPSGGSGSGDAHRAKRCSAPSSSGCGGCRRARTQGPPPGSRGLRRTAAPPVPATRCRSAAAPLPISIEPPTKARGCMQQIGALAPMATAASMCPSSSSTFTVPIRTRSSSWVCQ